MKSKKAIRKDVASSLQMNGKVSSRSIAYAVIQVFFPSLFILTPLLMALIQLLFNLWDIGTWAPVHAGFDFHACYCFVIDFFDVARGANAKARARKLLDWWNTFDILSLSFSVCPDLLFISEVFPTGRIHGHPSKSTSHKALEAQRAARER
jgi:hypothetical protein